MSIFAVLAGAKLKRTYEVSAGTNFSLLLSKNSVFGWGDNQSGKIGDNTDIAKCTPVGVSGNIKTFRRINAGYDHSVAIDKNGRVWAWGNNFYSQLGNNSIINEYTPISVLGAVKTFCQISAGNLYTLAIDKNGRAWGWGYSYYGAIGGGISSGTPISVNGTIKTFCQIGAGDIHSLAIDKNGRAWAWGYSLSGATGLGITLTAVNTPVSVAGAVKTFCRISAGFRHSAAIDKNGKAWTWGSNSDGELGDNSTVLQCTPVGVTGTVKTFCQINAGENYTLAIDKNGRAWAWGYNVYGQLGDNSTDGKCTPVSVAGTVKTFCQISAGTNHSLAIDKYGKAWAWGSNFYSQLGNASENVNSRPTPVSVTGAVKTFCKISAGEDHTLAIDKNGKAWAWGKNLSQQLGNNSTTDRRTPISVIATTITFCQINAGLIHSLGIDKNGRAWAWGSNVLGQIGNNTNIIQPVPTSVLGAIKTFCHIRGGGSHSAAIDKNGRAWAWGNNGTGQLGDNSITSRRTPVSVLGTIRTFCQISAGSDYSAAIDKNGRAWAWGSNTVGQIGDNSTVSKRTPVSVAGAVKTFCRISGNYNHSAAIDKNGKAWTWGSNAKGQLGDNSTVSKCTPVSVAGAVKTFCHISTGGEHTLAIDKNGRAWGWGYNVYGQLGDNSIDTRLTPVSILGAVKTFCEIHSGEYYSAAIDKNGRAWAWGYNVYGQLGLNTDSRTPVQVCNI